jgi:Holliday junction resolvasome RuvABC endonuclease subunit
MSPTKVTKVTHVIGIDASLTNTAIAIVDLAGLRRKPLVESLSVMKAETFTDMTLRERLTIIHNSIVDRLQHLRMVHSITNAERISVAMEGFSYGERFQRETLGAVQGVIHLAVSKEIDQEITLITPYAAKMFICPKWPGATIENWKANGYTGAFKRSMPGKDDVAQALFAKYKYDPKDEHVVDAILVAFTHAQKIGALDAKTPAPSTRASFDGTRRTVTAAPKPGRDLLRSGSLQAVKEAAARFQNRQGRQAQG